jgi:hypothetical protein
LKNIENILKTHWKILKKYWRVSKLNVLKVIRQILQKYHRYIVENICSIFYHPIFRREILSNSEESQLQAKNTGYSVKNWKFLSSVMFTKNQMEKTRIEKNFYKLSKQVLSKKLILLLDNSTILWLLLYYVQL